MHSRHITVLMYMIVLMQFGVPFRSFADCILTDTPYKFEVVCSGYNPTAPVSVVHRTLNSGSKSAGFRKANSVRDEKSGPADFMTDEEVRFMDTRNRQDGVRQKQRSGAKASGQLPTNQNPPV